MRHTSMTCGPLKIACWKMVEMKKDVSYPLVYSLVTLALILPVATATVEIAFSVMNIIKKSITQSNKRSADEWLLNYIYWEIYIQDYWVWRNHAAVSKYGKSSRANE